jgi:hypothetical protein
MLNDNDWDGFKKSFKSVFIREQKGTRSTPKGRERASAMHRERIDAAPCGTVQAK